MSNIHLRRTGWLAGVAAGALLPALFVSQAAFAQEDAAQKRDDNSCIFSSTVNNWRALDSRNLVVWAPNRKDAYHVTLSFPLHDLRTQESVAFVDRNGDGRLCGFGMDQIVTPNGNFTERSTIQGMERLDDAGLAALAEQYKVKLGPAKPDAVDTSIDKLADKPVK